MIVRFLRYARQRPPHVREQYALGIAGSVTGALALIWMLSLPSSPEEAARRVAEEQEVLRPFSALVEGVRSQFATNRELMERSTAAYRDEVEAGTAPASAASTSAGDTAPSPPGRLNLSPETIAAANARASATATVGASGTLPSTRAPTVSGARTSTPTPARSTTVRPGDGTGLPRISERRTVLIATTTSSVEKTDSSR